MPPPASAPKTQHTGRRDPPATRLPPPHRAVYRSGPPSNSRERPLADIRIKARDGAEFSAYLATPASGAGAGILLIQEVLGITPVMRDLADGRTAQFF